MNIFSNPQGWPEIPLVEVATLKRGYDLPVSKREKGKVPIYAANGQNGTHSEEKKHGPGVVTGRSGTIGKVHYVEGGYWPLNTALYVTDFHGNDPKWVYYMLKHFRLERFVQGAGVPTLNRNLVHGKLIPTPPFEEQQRIADILDKADGIRRKRQQAIDLADEFLRATFLDMFGDPVSNPANWPVKKLSDLSDKILNGTTPKGGSKIYVDQGVKFLRSQNVWKNNIILDNLVYLDEATHKLMAESSLMYKDILMTKTGRINTENSSLGRAALFLGVDGSANINGHVYLIRLKKEILNEFVVFILTTREYRDYIRSVSVGGIDKRQINKGHLEDFPIIFPDVELQEKFIKQISKVNKIQVTARSFKNKSNKIFESLSQKAFLGELT